MSGAPSGQQSTGTKFAEGWYMVCWSADLGPRAVMPLRYFARDFVLFRGETGKPTLLDAHCPHLGAHLGYGGCVEGDDIVCPFHAWRFSSEGRCVDVPYASRIPPRAALRSYPVAEHSEMILAYIGPEGSSPRYEVPPIEELDDPAWTSLERAEITIATQPREVIENVADKAHFRQVHNQTIDQFEMIIDGPRATQRTIGRGGTLDGKPISVETVATYHGPAVQFTHLMWAYDMVLINAHVPIDEENLILRFGVMLYTGEGVELDRNVILTHMAAARDGYFQDVAIWEHKRWRDKPLLADGDGPIGEIRKWYQSFFA
ncbi:MAG: Rieske 2Fe-2S domain-containing protein [Deltaproteobacteria bacterium]|nr:Rieske 2Fe-2S domain-containing protein [Deltaproteobacteria bacterium]